MKDLHTHILYGIDDGAKTKEESLKILKKAYQNGITDLVLTSHYIKDSVFDANNQTKKEILNEIKNELEKRDINLNLYLGNEVYIDEDIVTLLKQDEIATINNSRYLLIEFPLNNKILDLDDILYNLQQANLIPIIAHPERYLAYYENYEFFNALIANGCLLQANVGSIYGYFGKKSKKMVKELLKRKMVHFVGSDIHNLKNDVYEKNLEKDLLKIEKYKN